MHQTMHLWPILLVCNKYSLHSGITYIPSQEGKKGCFVTILCVKSSSRYANKHEYVTITIRKWFKLYIKCSAAKRNIFVFYSTCSFDTALFCTWQLHRCLELRILFCQSKRHIRERPALDKAAVASFLDFQVRHSCLIWSAGVRRLWLRCGRIQLPLEKPPLARSVSTAL